VITAVIAAWVLSSLPLGILIGRRFAGKSAFPPIRISPAAAHTALWVGLVGVCFALAFATRGQVVTWHGLVEVAQ
jgi:hypothetical protein